MDINTIIYWIAFVGIIFTAIMGIYFFRDEFKKFLPVMIVDSKKAVVLDNRLGKDRVIYEGINRYFPGVEVVVAELDLREHPADPPAQEIVTKDNIKIEVDMIAMMKIKDPKKAVFEVDNYKKAVESLVVTSTLKRLGTRKLEEIKNNQSSIAENIKAEINKEAQRWGIEVVYVEFESIDYSKAVKDAMEKELVAEKEKNAAISKAQGQHRVQELQAESEKFMIEKRAEATAKAIKDLKELMPDIPNQDIMEFLTKNAYIDSMKELSNSQNSKFVLYPSVTDSPMDKVVQTEYLSRDIAKNGVKEAQKE